MASFLTRPFVPSLLAATFLITPLRAQESSESQNVIVAIDVSGSVGDRGSRAAQELFRDPAPQGIMHSFHLVAFANFATPVGNQPFTSLTELRDRIGEVAADCSREPARRRYGLFGDERDQGRLGTDFRPVFRAITERHQASLRQGASSDGIASTVALIVSDGDQDQDSSEQNEPLPPFAIPKDDRIGLSVILVYVGTPGHRERIQRRWQARFAGVNFTFEDASGRSHLQDELADRLLFRRYNRAFPEHLPDCRSYATQDEHSLGVLLTGTWRSTYDRETRVRFTARANPGSGHLALNPPNDETIPPGESFHTLRFATTERGLTKIDRVAVVIEQLDPEQLDQVVDSGTPLHWRETSLLRLSCGPHPQGHVLDYRPLHLLPPVSISWRVSFEDPTRALAWRASWQQLWPTPSPSAASRPPLEPVRPEKPLSPNAFVRTIDAQPQWFEVRQPPNPGGWLVVLSEPRLELYAAARLGNPAYLIRLSLQDKPLAEGKFPEMYLQWFGLFLLFMWGLLGWTPRWKPLVGAWVSRRRGQTNVVSSTESPTTAPSAVANTHHKGDCWIALHLLASFSLLATIDLWLRQYGWTLWRSMSPQVFVAVVYVLAPGHYFLVRRGLNASATSESWFTRLKDALDRYLWTYVLGPNVALGFVWLFVPQARAVFTVAVGSALVIFVHCIRGEPRETGPRKASDVSDVA